MPNNRPGRSGRTLGTGTEKLRRRRNNQRRPPPLTTMHRDPVSFAQAAEGWQRTCRTDDRETIWRAVESFLNDLEGEDHVIVLVSNLDIFKNKVYELLSVERTQQPIALPSRPPPD